MHSTPDDDAIAASLASSGAQRVRLHHGFVADDGRAVIALSPLAVTRWLAAAALVVVGLAALMLIARYGFGYRGTTGVGRLFTLDAESNLPTWFSSALLLAAALLLWLLGRQGATEGGQRVRGYWYGLATIFTFLSIDETAQMHESLTERLRAVVPTEGALYYGWVIPAALFVMVVGLVYLRFLRLLPSRTAGLMALAGALYVGGAVGMEMVGAWLDFTGRFRIGSLGYTLVTMMEETLEMAGVILFVYGNRSVL